MAGPVWRFDEAKEAVCDVCLRRQKGLFVEGEVADNDLHPVRFVCRACASRTAGLVISGEVGGRVPGPAYAHNNRPLRP